MSVVWVGVFPRQVCARESKAKAQIIIYSVYELHPQISLPLFSMAFRKDVTRFSVVVYV